MPTVHFVLDGVAGREVFPSTMSIWEAWKAFEWSLIDDRELATWECGCCVSDDRIRNVRWVDDPQQ